ncbi:lysophospholipase-like protein 1 [Episyrphus balteatus]|uniref:lysophospholipase-like protein 1 n=1 Tax=Episyrphus balteatus TaxID=286459 RepID=UPI002485BE6D|nr:lysophospholipase-like protein 1 [Episyrphus balteatus]
MQLVKKTINPTGGKHSATVIFFHGSGDTGSNLVEWVRFLLGRDLDFPHIKLIYPTAPLQPYTPLNGELSNVWFDRRSITIDAKENRKSLASIYETVHELINEEEKLGIPPERIIVGGFSMGGALALHTAYHLNTDLAGVFACSSFLNRDSIVYDSLKNRTKPGTDLPELKMFHGSRDLMVPSSWGQESYDELTKLGVKGQFSLLQNTLHELKKRELLDIQEWISVKLPPLTNDLQNKL